MYLLSVSQLNDTLMLRDGGLSRVVSIILDAYVDYIQSSIIVFQ